MKIKTPDYILTLMRLFKDYLSYRYLLEMGVQLNTM